MLRGLERESRNGCQKSQDPGSRERDFNLQKPTEEGTATVGLGTGLTVLESVVAEPSAGGGTDLNLDRQPEREREPWC